MITPVPALLHSGAETPAVGVSEPQVTAPLLSVQLARTAPPEVIVTEMVPLGSELVQGVTPAVDPYCHVAPAPKPLKIPQLLLSVQVIFALDDP